MKGRQIGEVDYSTLDDAKKKALDYTNRTKKDALIEDISYLMPHGFSQLRFAYQLSYEILRLTKGSKNIVIITI